MFTSFTLLTAADEAHKKKLAKEAIGKEVVLRPQNPKKPVLYAEERVEYPNVKAGITLAGTLTFPKSKKPSPAVLLIAGSGEMDRDETVFGHKPFWVLADHLTRRGFAVLRVDKRGVGKSTGNFDTATSQDFAADALSGIEYLKMRKEVDAKQIGLVGHSEGGLIAPMVAAESHDIAFVVSMAGTGITGEANLNAQEEVISRNRGVPEEKIEQQIYLQRQVFSTLINEPDFVKAEELIRAIVSKHLSCLPEKEQQTEAKIMQDQIKRCNTAWFRYFLTCDPRISLKHIKIPFLAIFGDLDCQVPPKYNLPTIAHALKEAQNHNYKIIEFSKMNHFFQTCESGSILEYGEIEETIAPVVLQTMSDWIAEVCSSA